MALLVVAVALSLTTATAASSAAAPPPFVPHPPPIAGTFRLHPDSGPVGAKVTIKGACGFAATTLAFGVSTQDASGFHILWIPTEFATLKPNPIGVFSVTFTFPSAGNIDPQFGGQGNIPVVPGTYYVGATCDLQSPPTLPFEPFTVTA